VLTKARDTFHSNGISLRVAETNKFWRGICDWYEFTKVSFKCPHCACSL